jgi:hypothetical protein
VTKSDNENDYQPCSSGIANPEHKEKRTFHDYSATSEATNNIVLDVIPNPTDGMIVIRYSVIVPSVTHIDIVNLYGQRIATVVDGEQSQGNHNFKFDVSDLSNGMYFVQLRTPTGMVTKPIIVTH